nr:hypothetical protein [Tanacetum cinerariifolium]
AQPGGGRRDSAAGVAAAAGQLAGRRGGGPHDSAVHALRAGHDEFVWRVGQPNEPWGPGLWPHRRWGRDYRGGR